MVTAGSSAGTRRVRRCRGLSSAATSRSARARAAGSSRMVSARNWSGSTPASSASRVPIASSQRLSCGPSTSGWNWTARCRPIRNACTASSLRASTSAPAGSRQRSPWNSSQGPAGITSGSVESTTNQPISLPSMASTRPPSAAQSAWAPKQMPNTGRPAWSAARIQASSSAIQGSGSLTELTAPSTTMWSTPSKAGSGPSSGNKRTASSAPRASNPSAMKPAESTSWCLMTTTRILIILRRPLRASSFDAKLSDHSPWWRFQHSRSNRS